MSQQTATAREAWSGISNIQTLNSVDATTTLPSSASSSQRFGPFTSEFDYSLLPSTSVIEGIGVTVRHRKTGNGVITNRAQLAIYDFTESADAAVTLYGTNKSSEDTDTWSSDYKTVTFGGPGDLWGATASLSAATINHQNFGFLLGAGWKNSSGFGTNSVPRVDQIVFDIYYSTSSTDKSIFPAAGRFKLVGLAPSASGQQKAALTPALAKLKISGLAPKVVWLESAAPDLAVMKVIGYAPLALKQGVTLAGEPAKFTLVGLAPVATTTQRTVTPGAAIIRLGELAPTAVGSTWCPIDKEAGSWTNVEKATICD